MIRPQAIQPGLRSRLVRQRRRAGVANQLVGLLENVGVGGLLAGEEGERDKGGAEHQAYQHDPAVRTLVGGVK